MKKLNRRILAFTLAVVMMVTSISIPEHTVAAAEKTELILGADYIVTSKSSGKVLDVEGNSNDEGAKIVQMKANDKDDFQIWTLTDGGDGYYNLVNKVSGKGIDVPSSSKKAGTELKQYNNGSNRNYQKFAITDAGDGYYRITPKQVENFAIRVKDNSKNDGASIIQAESKGDDCEKWSFKLIKPDYAISDYNKVARQAYDKWIDKFYEVKDGKYGYLKNNNGYWTEFEALEMFIDAYEHFGDQKYLDLAVQFYDGLMDKDGTNWEWNGYTDDTMYMTLATVRLYRVTNNPQHLNIAKRNFDLVYKRAVRNDGAMVWCTDENKQHKNACANCPTMLAAVYLGWATGDNSYIEKAERIWDWTYPHLFEEQYKQTGGYDDSGIQGIFIGSSALLYSATGKQKYKDVALRACEIANTLGKGANEILDGEGVKGGDYNSVAAKGILARWLGYFLEVCPEITKFDYWMEINADSAWHNRNSDDLMWGHFGTKTMEKVEECEDYYESGDNVKKKQYASWACSAAVSWLINCTGLPVVGKPVENANKLEAEDATITGGAIVKETSEASGGKCVENIGTRAGSLQFNFKNDNDGKALVSLYSASSEAGKYNVTVNDKNTYTVDCPSGSAPARLSVDLVKGDNTLIVSGVVGENSPSLDYVGVNPSYYLEAEAGYTEHGARKGKDESYSGNRDIEWLGGDKGGSITFSIPAEVDGKAALSFIYATGGDRKLNMIVNGKSNKIDCKSTGSWDKFSKEAKIVELDLKKGLNEIIFTGDGKNSAPNLDWFELEWPYNEAKIADKNSIVVYDPEAELREENQKVANAVIAMMEGISEAELTLEDAQRIAQIRASYDALTQEQKNLIPNDKLELLTRAETKLKELQEEADKGVEDRTAADVVIVALENISGKDITLVDAVSIAQIRASYEALTQEQKNLVPYDKLEILTRAETKLKELQEETNNGETSEGDNGKEDETAADKAAADAVIVAIENIREAEITVEDAERIAQIRASYEALTQEQKNLLPYEKLTILTQAETKLKELQEAADKDETDKDKMDRDETDKDEKTDKDKVDKDEVDKDEVDKEAVNAVIVSIESIRGVNITLADAERISNLRVAYEVLTQEQKKLISTETLGILTSAEAKLEELSQQNISNEKEEQGEVSPSVVENGDVYTYKNVKYVVTKADMKGQGTVAVIGMKKNQKTVVIPSAVKLQGVDFKVTSIGKNAFKGCSKLKTIKIQTKNLKSVGKNAFKGIHKNAKIKVPSSKLKKYTSLLKKKGQSKNVAITK